jgi:hypothetical protein
MLNKLFSYTIRSKINANKFLPGDNASTKYWSGTDTENRYKENLKKQPPDWHYRTHSVTYTFNSEGYRTQEFNNIDWANSVVIFGCSHVLGTGLDDKDTVSSQIENILGLPVVNMGVGGSSMFFNFHNSSILRDAYPTPRGVIMVWPQLDRITRYEKTYVEHLGAWNLEPNDLMDIWNKNKYHAELNAVFISKITRQLWEDRCAYCEASWHENTASVLNVDHVHTAGYNLIDRFLKDQPADFSRDMYHSGIKTAYNAAVLIAKKLNL